MKNTILVLTLVTFISACATAPSGIRPLKTSSRGYQSLTCEELSREAAANNDELKKLSAIQREMVFRDTFAFLMGIFVIFPMLIILIDDDHGNEIASLKGKQQAILDAMNEIQCDSEIIASVPVEKEKKIGSDDDY